MRRSLILGGLTAAAAVTALIASPIAAGAFVNGGCTATGTATGSPGVDITTQNVWHVRSDDVISGVGEAPTDQKNVKVDVVMFGIHAGFKPLIDAHGNGSTSGHGGQYKVSDYSKFARVFYIGGNSDSCDGGVLIVIDDVSAYKTVAGGAGLGLTGLAVLGLVGLGFMHTGRIRYVFGAVVGLLGGVGLGVFLEQTGTIDPASQRTLAIPIAGLLVGTLLAGALAGEGGVPEPPEPTGPTPTPPPPPPTPPPAPAPPSPAADA